MTDAEKKALAQERRAASLREFYSYPLARERRAENARKMGLAHAGKGNSRPLGSYNGVKKKDRIRINAEAKQYAAETIKIMAAKGIITPEDDPRAEEALKAALETMRTPTNQPMKLAAAKLILEYTKAKPASKSEVTVNKAEEWLAAITSEEKNDKADDEGPEGDTQASS